MRQVRRAVRRSLATAAALALIVVAAPAHADNVVNDVVASGNGTIDLPASGPGSTVVSYSIEPNGAGGNPGCDATASSPALLSIAAPAQVTVSPNPVRFTDCHPRAVEFSSATPGSYEITVGVSDDQGQYNINRAEFTLTVNDRPANTPPEVTVGGVEDGPAYEHGAVPAAVCNVTDAEDNDASADASLSDVTGEHADLGLGEQTATCSYTDAGGETATATATYSIVDTTAPVLSVPGDISAEADGPDGAVVEWEATATDAVDPDPVVDCTGGASGDTYRVGTTAISCTSEDAVGNSASADFAVTVVDETQPTLTLPEDTTVEAAGPDGAVVEYDATARDSVDGTITPACAPASGSTFAPGATTVECSATDAAGNTTAGSFDVRVVDTTAPALDLPDDRLVEASGPDGAVVEYNPSAVDRVDGDVEVTCAPAAGATFPLGETIVSCSAQDDAGNRASGSFTVTVEDTTAPALDLPEDITAEAAHADGAEVSFDVTASDVVDGAVAVDCLPESGSVFPLGETTVDCSAPDAAGNIATGSFAVTVQDTTAPSLFVPTDDVVAEATGPDGATVEYDVSATDTVDADVDVVCDPSSGSTFALGATTVECTATDDAGNQASDAFRITVQDTTGPEITVSEVHPTEAVGPDGAPVSFDAQATDLVDGAVDVDCAPPSGSTFPLGDSEVTCTATDTRGNSSTMTRTVTVEDTTAPMLTVPSEVVEEAAGPHGATVDFDDQVSAHDLVNGDVAVSCDPESGATFALGETRVDCTASDARGNAAQESFPVRVVDTTAPELSLPAGLVVEATGPDGAVVSYDAEAADLVDGDVEVDCTPASGTTLALGSQRVDCAATDAAGNTATGSFTVDVLDTTAPQLSLPEDMTVEATGPDGEQVIWEARAYDVVDGGVAVTCDPTSGSTFDLGTSTVACAASDAAGNTASGSFAVTVQDTTAPELSLPDDSATTATSADGAAVTYSATARDLVDGVVPVDCAPESGSTFAPGTTTVTCTSGDESGNSTSGTFTVMVSFDFGGFLRPVDGDGLNNVKGGATVPLKWQIRTADGGEISSLDVVSAVRTTSVDCRSGEAGEELAATPRGATELRYAGGQYIYNWKTPSKSRSCYEVAVVLTDGTRHSAQFAVR